MSENTNSYDTVEAVEDEFPVDAVVRAERETSPFDGEFKAIVTGHAEYGDEPEDMFRADEPDPRVLVSTAPDFDRRVDQRGEEAAFASALRPGEITEVESEGGA